ncbi:MAG: hypothetical protein PUF03_08150 [Lachnospiraceae bacterium]|nr:hypothetical protein [Lachnospiraceae bacterium]
MEIQNSKTKDSKPFVNQIYDSINEIFGPLLLCGCFLLVVMQ